MHGEPDLLENLRAVFPGWRTWLDRAVALARAAAFDAPLAGVIKVPQFGIEVLGPGLLVVLAAVTQPPLSACLGAGRRNQGKSLHRRYSPARLKACVRISI